MGKEMTGNEMTLLPQKTGKRGKQPPTDIKRKHQWASKREGQQSPGESSRRHHEKAKGAVPKEEWVWKAVHENSSTSFFSLLWPQPNSILTECYLEGGRNLIIPRVRWLGPLHYCIVLAELLELFINQPCSLGFNLAALEIPGEINWTVTATSIHPSGKNPHMPKIMAI